MKKGINDMDNYWESFSCQIQCEEVYENWVEQFIHLSNIEKLLQKEDEEE
jgi:hypothetical protein